MSLDFLTLKALHIIFVITWFCGLFYFVRLLIYYKDTENKKEVEKQVLKKEYLRIMRLLWVIITTPSMIITLILGTTILIKIPTYLEEKWMQLKLLFVVLLVSYHFICGYIYSLAKEDKLNISSIKLRLWNEIATVFLVAIVFLVVKKNATDWLLSSIYFFTFFIVLMLLVKIAKKIRG